MSTSNAACTVSGITVFVRVCPPADPTAPLSRRASAILDKKSSFASSYALKNSFISSKPRKSSVSAAGEFEKCVVAVNERTLRIVRTGAANRDGDKEYTFDRVYPEDSSQEEICIGVHEHALEVVAGYNSTIICFGASKSGKSYTMTGTKDARGIIPHAIKSVFAQIDKARALDSDLYFYTELGYVELYNNNFRDLLQNAGSIGSARDDDEESVVVVNDVGELDSLFDTPSAAASVARKGPRTSNGSATPASPWSVDGDQKIQVHESKNLGVFLSGSPTLRVPVSSAQDVFQLYSRGQKLRSSRVTDSGHVSSRSHAILILYVESRTFSGDAAGLGSSLGGGSLSGHSLYSLTTPSSPDQRAAGAGLRMSKLTFVDMAGSDRLEKSGAVGDTLVESQNINLSLTAFGDVLFALSKNAAARAKQQKGSQHVPYLNSKLTQFLRESLGGNAKTVMLATIHSTADYSKVTETSLQYAMWASTVRGKVVRNDLNMGERWIQETDPEILRLRKLLEERSREFAKLRVAQLSRSPTLPTATSSPAVGRSSFFGASPLASGANGNGSVDNSPLGKLQKRIVETSTSTMTAVAVTESKSSFHEASLKTKISDLEQTNQELKEDLARKARQSADLSVSLKKALELVQQQNKALTDQLTDVSHEKDVQIEALNKQVAALEAEMQHLRETALEQNQGGVDSALDAANAELERAKKSAWDRYLTITEQQERIAALEASLEAEKASAEQARRELADSVDAQTGELRASLDGQKQALDEERARLHAALKAAEEHVAEQEQHLQEQHSSQAYQISSLKDQVEALKADLAAKEGELTQARQTVQEGQECLAKESRLLSAERVKSGDLQASLDMHIALVSSLKMKMANLQGQVAEDVDKLTAQQRTQLELEAEVVDLRESLLRTQRDYDTSGAALQAKLEATAAELQKAREGLEAKEASLQALEQRVASQAEVMCSERQASLQELEELQGQLREQVESHQQLNAKYLERTSEAEALEEALRAARMQLDANTADGSTLSKKLAAQEQLLAEEKARAADLAQNLQRAQKLHEVSVTQFTDELLELNVKLQTSENLAETLNLTVAENEKQIAFLQRKIEEIMVGSETEVFAAQEQMNALEGELQELRAMLEGERARCKGLESDGSALRADVSAREVEKKRLLEQKQELEDRLAREVQKRKAEVEAAHESRQEALAASKADFDEYARLADLKVAGLTQDLAAADQRYEEAVAAFNDRIQDEQLAAKEVALTLEEKAGEIQALLSQLSEARAAREQDAVKAEVAAAEAAGEIAELQAAIAAQQRRFAALDAEYRAISDSLATKQAEIAVLAQSGDATRSELVASLDSQVALNASLRLRNDMLQNALDEEVALRKNREQRVADLELINGDLERAAQSATKSHLAALEEISALLEQRSAEVDNKGRLLREEEGRVAQLIEQVSSLQSKIEIDSASLSASQQRIAALESALEQSRQQQEQTVAELHDALRVGSVVETMTSELTALRSTLHIKEQMIVTEVHRYTTDTSALEERLASLGEEVEARAAELARAKGDHAADRAGLLAQLEELRIVVSELENALSVKDASLGLLVDKLAAQEQRTVAEVNARIAELGAYEAHNAELRSEISSLQQALMSAEQESGQKITQLTAESQKYRERIDELSRLVESVEGQLQAALENLEQQQQRADAEAAARNQEAATAHALASTLQATVAKLEAQLKSAMDAHAADDLAMMKQAEESSRANADLVGQLDETNAALRDALENLTLLEAQLSERSSTADDFESRLGMALAEAEELKEALNKARKMHSLAEEAFRAESEADVARIEELSAALSAAESELGEREEKLQALLAEAAAVSVARSNELAIHEKVRCELQTQVDELTSRLKTAVDTGETTAYDLGARLEEALRRVDELGRELAETTDTLQEARSTAADLEDRITQLNSGWSSSVSAVEEQLACVLTEKAELQERLEKTRKMHALAEATFAAESEGDQNKIDELTAQVTALEAELAVLREQLASLHTELAVCVPASSRDAAVSELQDSHLAEMAALRAEFDTEVAALLFRLQGLEADERCLRSEASALSEHNASLAREARRLEEQVTASADSIAALEAELCAKEAENRMLHAKTVALEKVSREDAEKARALLEAEKLRMGEQAQLANEAAAVRQTELLAYAAQIDALNCANSSLREEISSSSEHIRELQDMLWAREEDIDRLQRSITDSSASHAASTADLRSQIQERVSDIEDLRETIAHQQRELEVAVGTGESKQAEIRTLLQQLEAADRSYEALDRKLIATANERTAEGEAYRAHILALEQAVRDGEGRVEDAMAAVFVVNTQLEDVRALHADQLDAMAADLQARSMQLADCHSQLLEKEREAEGLGGKIAELESERETLLKLLRDGEDAQRLLSDQLAAARDELSAEYEECAKYRSELAAAVDRCGSVESSLAENVTQLERLRVDLADSATAVSSARDHIASLSADRAAAAERADELQRMFEEQTAVTEVLKVKLDQEVVSRDAQAVALRAELAAMQTALDGVRAEVTVLMAEKAAETTRCEELESVLAARREESERACAELERQIDSLHNALTARTAQAAAAELEVARLRGVIDSVQDSCDAAVAAAEKSGNDLAVAMERLSHSEDRLQEAKATVANMGAEAALFQEHLCQLELQLAEAQFQCESFRAQLAEIVGERDGARSEKQRLSVDLAAALARVEELQRMFEEQVALVEVLHVKLAEQEKHRVAGLSESRATINGLSDRIAELEASGAAARESAASYETRCEALSAHIDGLQREFDTARIELEGQLASSRSKCMSAVQALAVAEEEAELLRGQVDELSDANAALKKAHQDSAHEAAAAQRNSAELESRLLLLDTGLENQTAELAQVRQAHAELAQDHARLNEKIAGLLADLLAASQQETDLRVQLAAALARVEELQRMFEEQVALVEVLHVKLAEQEERYQRQVEVLTVEAQRLISSVAELEYQNGQLVGEGAAAHARCEGVEQDLADARATWADVRAELQGELDFARASVAGQAELLERARLETDVLKQQVSRLEASNDALAAEQLAADIHNKEVTQQLADANADVKSAEQEVARVSSVVQQLTESLEDLRKQLAEVDAEKTVLAKQIERMDSAEANANEQAQLRLAELAAALARVEELERMFEEQVALVEVLHVKLAEQEERHAVAVVALNSQLANQQADLQALRSSNDILSVSEGEARDKCADLLQQVHDLEAELQAARSQTTLQADASELAARDARALIDQLEQEAQDLRGQLGDLNVVNLAVSTAAQERLLELQAMASRLAESESQLERTKAVLAEKEGEAAAADSRCAELREQLVISTSQLAELQSKLDDAEHGRLSMQLDMAKIVSDYEDARARMDVLQRMFEEQVALVEVLRLKLTEEEHLRDAALSNVRDECDELKLALADLRERYSEVSGTQLTDSQRCVGLEQQLADLQALHLTLTAELGRQLDDCRASMATSSDALNQCLEEVATLRARAADLEAVNHSIAVAAQDRLLEVNATRDRLSEVVDLVETLKAQCEEKEQLLASANKFKAALKAEIEQRDEEIGDLERQVNQVATELEAANQWKMRVEELQRMFEEQVALVEVLHVKLAEQEVMHTTQLSEASTTASSMQARIDQLSADLTSAGAAKATVESRSGLLEQQLADLHALHSTLVSDLRRQGEDAWERCATADKALSAAQKEIVRLKELLSDLEATNHAVAVAAQDRLLEVNAAKARLSDAVEQLLELKSDLDTQAEQTAAVEKLHQAALEALQQNELQRSELQRMLKEAQTAGELSSEEAAVRAGETVAALARVEELQRMFEEQVALVEVLKLKLVEQEELHAVEVGTLKQRILDLCASLQSVQDQNADLLGQNTSAICKLADLDREVKNSTLRAENLAASLDAKVAEVALLKGELQESAKVSAEKLVTTEERLLALQALSSSQAVSIADLNALKVTLAADLARRQSEVAALTEQKEGLEVHYARSEAELQSRVVALTERNGELQAEVDQQVALASMLRMKMKALQDEYEECSKRRTVEAAELEHCRSELGSTKSSLAQCQAACEAKVASLMDSAAQAKKVQELMSAQLNDRIEQVAAVEKELQAQSSALQVRGEEVARLEATLAELRMEKAAAIEAAEERARECESKAAALRADQEAHERYVGETEAQHAAFREELAQRVEDIERLELQLEKLREDNKSLEAQVSKLRVQLGAAQARLEEEGHKRVHQLAMHEQKLAELEVAKVASDQALQRYEAKVAALTAELGAFNTKKSERVSI